MQNKWESSSMFTKKGRPSGKGGTCGSTKSALHKLAVQGMLKFFHPRRPSHSPGKGRCSYRDGCLSSRDSCERLALDRFLKRKSFIHTGRAGSHFCAKANKRGSRRIIHPAAPSGPLACRHAGGKGLKPIISPSSSFISRTVPRVRQGSLCSAAYCAMVPLRSPLSVARIKSA